MSDKHNVEPIGSSCEARPTTTSLDSLALQEEFTREYVRIADLEYEERYDELLDWLKDFWEKHHERDRDQWLGRAIGTARTSILYHAGRHEEALASSEEVGRLGFGNMTDRWSHADTRARILEALGRNEEALRTFETAFREQDARYLDGAVYYVPSLVSHYRAADKEVDPQWRSLAEAIAAEYEVDLPQRDSLAETLLALHEKTRGLAPRRARERQAKP